MLILCFTNVVVLFLHLQISRFLYAISAWDCIEKYEVIIWLVLRKTALYQALAAFMERYGDIESSVWTPITDTTNNKTYSGTYKVQQKTPDGTDYEVIIDGINGYATVAQTEYYDHSEIPTLPINIGDYSIYFIPKN